MADASTHAMMLRAVVDLVPNWYVADCGAVEHVLTSGGASLRFWSTRTLTPNLYRLLGNIRRLLPAFESLHEKFAPTGFPEFIQESLALVWLGILNDKVAWNRIIDFARDVRERTSENRPVPLNLIISGREGSVDLSSRHLRRLVDEAGTSQWTCLRVDPRLRFVGYEQIPWSQIEDAQDYKFHPEFLHPYHCRMDPLEWGCHLTSKGDLLVTNYSGLVAAKRRGRWKLYDMPNLKNSLVDILGAYRVACNLFELAMDLSFKRHGALLVYDPDHKVLAHVNESSRFPETGEYVDSPGPLLAAVLQGVSIDTPKSISGVKRILAELASIDGAMLFDRSRILSVGSIIEVHPEVQREVGARTAAAKSALKWGTCPLKVSADGEATVHFKSIGVDERTCEAALTLL